MRTFVAVVVLTVLVVPFAFAEVYSNVVGLYKIDIKSGRNLVSMPFLPFSASLDDVIGDQLTGHAVVRTLSDKIQRWDPVALNWEQAWYNTSQGKWLDWDTGGDPTFGIDPDKAFWVLRQYADTTITVMGEVSETDRVMEVLPGRNMVAPSFPKEIALEDSGLVESGFTGHAVVKTLSDKLDWWDPATQTWISVWYKTGVGFMDFYTGLPTTKTIVPGEGFWLLRQAGTFTWTAPKPY